MSVRSELPFKLVFVAMFVAVAVVATRTARRAAATHGTPLNQLANELPALVVIRGLLGTAFYAMLAVWLVRAESPAWAQLPVPRGARWAAVALVPFAIAFFTWSHTSLGENHRGGVGLHEGHQLVTTGAYRWMRHPVYLAFIMLMILVAPITANWVIGSSGLALVSVIAAMRIPVEERQLAERFGPVWERYRESTGRLVPRLVRRA